MKKMFALLVAAPILALFVGIGVLSFGISQKWDERNTDMLINNLSLACVMGGVAMSLMLGALLVVVLYARWRQSRHWLVGGSQRRSLRTALPQQPWLDAPPALPPPREVKGKLYSSGAQGYEDIDRSLFGESPSDEMDWRETL